VFQLLLTVQVENKKNQAVNLILKKCILHRRNVLTQMISVTDGWTKRTAVVHTAHAASRNNK